MHTSVALASIGGMGQPPLYAMSSALSAALTSRPACASSSRTAGTASGSSIVAVFARAWGSALCKFEASQVWSDS
jgi:hypothetical protein